MSPCIRLAMEGVCVSEGTDIMRTDSETENVCTEEIIDLINDDFVKESGHYDLTLKVENHKIHVSKARC